MRRFWPLLAVALGAIAVAALVAELRHDSVSSTPGDVVERFLERILRERYEKAAALLAEDVERSTTPETLRTWKQEVESGLDRVSRVDGETEWISGEQAEATGMLIAGQRERRLRFALTRESGRWKIARLDEFWGDSGVGSDLGPGSDPGSGRLGESWREHPRDAPLPAGNVRRR